MEGLKPIVKLSLGPGFHSGPEEGQLPPSSCGLVADRKQFCGLNPEQALPHNVLLFAASGFN